MPAPALGAKTAERASSALLALAVLLLAAIPLSALLGGARDRARPAESLPTARSRLEMATRVRYETADAAGDTRFDQLLGALVAGLDADAPPELVAALEAAREGRAREKAAHAEKGIKSAKATPRSLPDPAVEENLSLASRALARAEAEAAAPAEAVLGGKARDWLALGALAAAVAALSLARLERSRRQGERRQIALHLGLDPATCDDGHLADDVALFATLAKTKAKRIDPVTRGGASTARDRVLSSEQSRAHAPRPAVGQFGTALAAAAGQADADGAAPTVPAKPPAPEAADPAERLPVAPRPAAAEARPLTTLELSALDEVPPSADEDPFAGLPFLPDPSVASENPRVEVGRLLEIELLPLDNC